MSILILYHSSTCNTQKVADLLALQLEAETAPIMAPAHNKPILGPLIKAWNILMGGSPEICIPKRAQQAWDLIVVGSPIWAARPAPEIRTYLKRYILEPQDIALFVTCDGTSKKFPPERAITEMTDILRHTPVATAIFTTADINGAQLAEKAAHFAKRLEATRPSPRKHTPTQAAKTIPVSGAKRSPAPKSVSM